MSEQDLQNLVAAAVRAVLEQLGQQTEAPAAKGPVVRVLIADTERGLDFALASLKAGPARVRLEYVLTSGRQSQVTTAFVREQGGASKVLTEAEAGCPLALARGADAVVAASLDRPSAMRVALTMPETFASKFLFEALRRGRPTIIATDGWAWEAPEATPQMRQALAEPVGRLEVFGAVCSPASELGGALAAALAS
ncbi:MAG: hypothetical protein HUU23_10430, partial [Caldilineales bacterium]|nr:hypothetical protein [Caldilineales bacterium]